MNFLIFLATLLLKEVIANPILSPHLASVLDAANPADTSDNCLSGFSQPAGSNWSSCYKIFSDFKNRNNAAAQCKKNGGTLASVPNSFINTYIYSLASQNKATSVWLGIECFNGDAKTCQNDDSTEFMYDNFYGGQPNVDGSCVYMSSIGRDSQKWSTFDCAQKFQYVCEAPAEMSTNSTVDATTIPTTETTSTTREGPLKCPDEYAEFENMCYTFAYIGIEEIPATFASTICQDIPGGNLATIPNSRVNSFIWSIRPTGVVSYTAFGLSCPNVTVDGDRKSCKWNDGTPFEYNAFEIPGVPHSYPFNGGCCDYNSGAWWDCYPCTQRRFDSYICQAPLQ